MIRLMLKRPPSANRLWRFSPTGVHRTKEYQTWLGTTQWEIKAQAKSARIEGPFKLTAMFRRPDKRRRDIDNWIKPILDGLQKGGVIKDDADCEWIETWWTDMIDADVIVELEECDLEEDRSEYADHRD